MGGECGICGGGHDEADCPREATKPEAPEVVMQVQYWDVAKPESRSSNSVHLTSLENKRRFVKALSDLMLEASGWK